MLPKLTETLEQARERSSHEPFDFSTITRAPRNNGELPGYRPSSKAVADASIEQGKLIKSTRSKERRSIIKRATSYGAIALAGAVLTAGAVKFGDRYIAHEQAPWDNHPAATHHK